MENTQLDDLRKPWESDEMWQLRRAFLERHWTEKSMTRNRLLSMAQMFVNMEFLGCKYDESLMAKVSDMSEGLVEERRDRRREVAEQVFTKGGKVSAEYAGRHGTKKRKQESEDEPATKRAPRSNTDGSVIVTTTHPGCAIKMKVLQAVKAELMVMQQQRQMTDHLDVLNQAANRAKCRWKVHFNDGARACYLQVDDVVIVEQVYWGSQARSRLEACRRALELLQRPFFDVRQIQDKKAAMAPTADPEMELFTRKDIRGEWEPPSHDRFDPLDQAFTAFRKRIAAIPEATRNTTPEKCLMDAAKAEDLPVDLKRQHLGGWKEQIIIIVGKVELFRNQGRIPPKGKEKESSDECYSKALEFLLKPTFSDGIRIAEENDELALHPKQKSPEKALASATTAGIATASRRVSREQNSDLARKELSLKSVRLHLNATSETMNPVQRIEQSCVKAKVPYDVQLGSESPFEATVFVDGVRAGSAFDATKKGAKNKACQETVQQLLRPYIRIKSGGGDEFVLEAAQDPFDG